MRKTITAMAAFAVAGAIAVAPSLGASTKTVTIKDNRFAPKTLAIAKGTKVRWVWRGKALHNVAVATGPSTFRASTRKRGHFDHTFTKAGTYQIVCTIHAPDMRMTVRVR
jgi:plastocyanin